MLAEDRAVARERGQALLHARAGRLDEPEHGHARAAGQAQHLDDRLRVRLPERAARERRVLRVAEHLAPVDPRVRREHAVAGTRALAHPARAHLGAQRLQRSGVGQDLQALERRQALVGALEQRERHARLQAQHRVVAAEAERVRQRERRRGPRRRRSGRAAPGT